MDRAAITEIFDYNEFAWRQIMDEIAPRGDALLTAPAPGSGWPALADCLGHVIMAYEVWIEALHGKPRVAEDGAPPIKTLGELERFASRVRNRFRDYLASLSDEQLFGDIEVNAFGDLLAYTRAEILGNTVLHERGHHGDVNTLLYQHGIDGGVPDYRFFVNEKRGYE